MATLPTPGGDTDTWGDELNTYLLVAHAADGTLRGVVSGTGTPEGAVTAAVGTLYRRTDGGTGTTLYIKETGAGNTGWVAAASGAGAAPTNATYITQTANGTLSAEQAMSSLATGLVKNTTATGVQSIAVEGVDYAPVRQFFVPTWTGGNDAAAINTAITAAVAAGGGVVVLPSGTGTTAGGHVIPPKVRVVGQGVAATTITHTGNNACFMLFDGGGVTEQRAGVEHMLINGNSGASAVGLEVRDISYAPYAKHLRIAGYTAGVGVKAHNFASGQFVEGLHLQDVSIRTTLKCIQFYVTSGTSSFNGTRLDGVALQPPASGTAIEVCPTGSAAGIVYNSEWNDVKIWFGSFANNFGIDVGDGTTATFIRDSRIFVNGEGASGTATAVRVQAAATFVHTGDIQLGDNVPWTITGTYKKLGNQPQGLGNYATALAAVTFTGARAAPTDGPVIAVTGYNNTNPFLPGTTNVLAVTKEGHIKPISGQANAKIAVVSNVLTYTDPNSLVYSLSHGVVTANTQTGSYTLVMADAGKVVEMNVASGNNLTVPLNATVAFPVGTTIEIYQMGAGQTTVVATGGVTIRNPVGLKLRTQYSSASLRKRATDEWVLTGDTAA